MSSILSIAVSGLAAASRRLQVAANNIANVESDGALPADNGTVTAVAATPASSGSSNSPAQYPSAYVPQQVNQVATAGGGTAATVTAVQPSTVAAYDPTAPYANGNGEVAQPNVDLTTQALQLAIARYTFAMNAQVIRAYRRTTQSLLNIET